MRRIRQLLLAAIVLYATWIGMLVTHEFGHMLHAWWSGGRVAKVSLPLLGFSQTIVWPNPRELFVVWGGPIWGCLIPLLGALVFPRIARQTTEPSKFFAGFCLIANGAYIGAGAFIHTGDAGDMIRLGASWIVMLIFGVVCASTGLFFWHRSRWLTSRRDQSRSS